MKTFKATVNTGIYLFKKSSPEEEKNNFVITADFHGLDIKNGDLEAALELIIDVEPDEKCKDGCTIISDREIAIYAYRQKVINNFSNLSFFIASPKLFELMQDVGNLKPKIYTDEKGVPVIFDIKKQRSLFDQEGPNIYQVDFNGEIIKLVKLGDMAEVKQGLCTGDNKYYLRSIKCGGYKKIDLSLVLKEYELEKIINDEKLRMDIIENGICTNPEHKTHQHRYFSDRYFIPYDKGGASNIEEGWLPNYYVPTPYFIDWSEEAIKRMKTLTIAEKNKSKGLTIIPKKHEKTLTTLFKNKQFYFKNGVTLSFTGFYAPMFRYKGSSIFDEGGPSMFFQKLDDIYFSMGILCSKFIKFLCKAFIDHTVNFQVEEQKNIPLIFNAFETYRHKLDKLVSSIIHQQKQDPRYDYMTNEQIEIDKLVYKMYNLKEEDIEEIENWYFRRYPKLAKVIEEKLKKKNKGE
jgi:hypothetical protein